MTDYFALLDEPRRPWGDPESLKHKFLLLSNALHPDHAGDQGEVEKRAAQDRYMELNAAYQCLREPQSRLQHLLELEWGAKASQIHAVPPDLMEASLEISRLCREADALIAEKAQVTSPLLKVRLFAHAQAVTEKLLARQKALNSQRETLLARLKEADALWSSTAEAESPNHAPVRQSLEGLWRLFGYIARWSGQIQTRIVQLAL